MFLRYETPMFLVELEAGREAEFESVEALASAIRRGEVGPKARIFHRASSRWVSITVHPEFRKIAAERASASFTRKRWTFYSAEPEEERVAPVERPLLEESVMDSPAESASRRSGWRAALRRAFRHEP